MLDRIKCSAYALTDIIHLKEAWNLALIWSDMEKGHSCMESYFTKATCHLDNEPLSLKFASMLSKPPAIIF